MVHICQSQICCHKSYCGNVMFFVCISMLVYPLCVNKEHNISTRRAMTILNTMSICLQELVDTILFSL